MRAMMLAGLFALTGALIMTATADEPKKDAPKQKDPSKPADYDEKVTVRKLNGKTFLNPVKDVPAFRIEKKDKIVFCTRPLANNSESPKGSEITDKDGNVYVVTQSTNNALGFTRSEATMKPKDK